MAFRASWWLRDTSELLGWQGVIPEGLEMLSPIHNNNNNTVLFFLQSYIFCQVLGTALKKFLQQPCERDSIIIPILQTSKLRHWEAKGLVQGFTLDMFKVMWAHLHSPHVSSLLFISRQFRRQKWTFLRFSLSILFEIDEASSAPAF